MDRRSDREMSYRKPVVGPRRRLPCEGDSVKIAREILEKYLTEAEHHLTEELLPFWISRCKDEKYGGFITHFDRDGNDTGEDQKSLISQTRTVYSMSAAHRDGYGNGRCRELAEHGFRFLIDSMWDRKYGGFFWTTDRSGKVQIDKKVLYGHSFAVYALSTYAAVTGNASALEYVKRIFELIQSHAADTYYGGYFEMFERDWTLAGPGSDGGDRKTLDVHMHLMEAYTELFAATGEDAHRRKLTEVILLLLNRILHPEYRTGIPQFWEDWSIAPQIKFNIVWGWDRFTESGVKEHAEDNTSAGHNAELVWLLLRAHDVLGTDWKENEKMCRTILDHVCSNGIDTEHGGVFVEGPHSGGVYDREKEFWQQAEVMIGLLEGYIRFSDERYIEYYDHVHRFVFDRMINHPVGEWWPLTKPDGEPIWTHMSHSWKVNYHTIRSMLECIRRLKVIRGN